MDEQGDQYRTKATLPARYSLTPYPTVWGKEDEGQITLHGGHLLCMYSSIRLNPWLSARNCQAVGQIRRWMEIYVKGFLFHTEVFRPDQVMPKLATCEEVVIPDMGGAFIGGYFQ